MNKTRLKKQLRLLYKNYKDLRGFGDNRHRGYQKPIMKELLRNLRLLRNNYKGITDKIYDLIYNMKPKSIVAIKLNSIFNKCSYYLILQNYSSYTQYYIKYININELRRELNETYYPPELFVYPFSSIPSCIKSYF